MTIALALTSMLLVAGADSAPSPAALRWGCQVTRTNGAVRPFSGYWLGSKKNVPEAKAPDTSGAQ